ncbi:hypothetical protein ABIE45_004418 [Methylobacterium sp. OAE515]|uniref:DUF3168 domain-containing protein n=1 Tax=Methylobacterium sp. OAE515 TaxID=2817895 RepID=UPI00178BBADD
MIRPTTPELALRDALRSRLKADPDFTALVGKRFYDEVPAGIGRAEPNAAETRPPYAYLGPMRRAGYAESCVATWTIQARLYAVSTAYDRDQGWLLADAMIAALNGLEQADLPLAEPYGLRTPIEVVQAGDVIDPLQAKSVFLDLRTTIARPLPGQED